jgi:hypothetical protein
MNGRTVVTVALFSVACLSLPVAAQVAQNGAPNPSLWESTPDAAALGSGGRGFLSYGLDDRNRDWMIAGGFRFFGGVLRASYGKSSNFGTLNDYAIGYARSLYQQSFAPWVSWGAGVDLLGASQQSQSGLYNNQAVRLMVPFSMRLGSPTAFSIAPYVGPYAELANGQHLRGCDANGCANSFLSSGSTLSGGMAFGAEVTAWRLGLTVGAAGVPAGLRAFRPGWKASAAVRIRF